jgi:hypothetical protein
LKFQPPVVETSDARLVLADQLVVGERDGLESRAAEREGMPLLADPDGLLGDG